MNQCAECGMNAMRRFRDEPMTVDHGRFSSAVAGLSGWRCEHCGEVLFDAEDAVRYSAAGDALVLQGRK